MGAQTHNLGCKSCSLKPFQGWGSCKGNSSAEEVKLYCSGNQQYNNISPLKIRLYLVEALLVWKFLQFLQRLPPPETMKLITRQT